MNKSPRIKASFKAEVPAELREMIANVIDKAANGQEGEYLVAAVPHNFGDYHFGLIWAIIEETGIDFYSGQSIAFIKAITGMPFIWHCSEGSGLSSRAKYFGRSLRHIMKVDGRTVLKYFGSLAEKEDEEKHSLLNFDIDWDNIEPIEY